MPDTDLQTASDAPSGARTRTTTLSFGPALGDAATLRQALLAGQVDVVTFTASSIVDHFVTAVGADVVRSGRFGVAAIGPVTAETARGYGMTVEVEPAQYTTAGLVQALVEYYGEGGKGKGNR